MSSLNWLMSRVNLIVSFLNIGIPFKTRYIFTEDCVYKEFI